MSSNAEPAINITGEFVDPALEKRFRVSRLPDARTQMRGILLGSGFFFTAFFVTDFMTLGASPIAFMLLGLRLAVAAVILNCWLLLRRHPDSTAVVQAGSCAVAVAALAAFQVITWYRPSDLPWLTMSMAVMLMILYLYMPNRLRYAVMIGVPASLAFGATVRLQGGAPGYEVFTMALVLVTINAFGYIAALRHQSLWRAEYLVQARLEQLSLHDQLTGCYNRRYLQDKKLDGELRRARRSGQPVTVILCDIDHFKKINDSYGHQAGDEVLVAFAAQLRAATRQQVDAVVRYGGEEFLLVLPDTGLTGGAQLAERLRASVAATPVVTLDGPSIMLTASFGVATIDMALEPGTPSLLELIGTADTLLYQSKNGGRNQVHARQLG